MTQNILTAENIKVDFNGHCVLNNINFIIKRDSVVAFVGANGSGKTVLFKSLLNLIDYKGKIKWAEDAKVGYVPQKLSVQKDLPVTVMEFFKLKEIDDKKIYKVLDLVGFRQKAEHIHHDIRVLDTKLGSLSGGELQRILIAYALLGNPNTLLLDEPTAGVDIEGEETIYSLFETLKKNNDLTILFISHDQEIVKKYADEIITLKHEH